MNPVSKGKLPVVLTFDIEGRRVGELRRVAVGCTQHHVDEVTLFEGLLVQLAVLGDGARRTLKGTVETQKFLDSLGVKFRVGAECR